MVTLTPEQFEHFIRVMILVALLGGLVGAVIWDLIQASGLGMVSGIGYLFDRHKRIKAARARASAESASVAQFSQDLAEAQAWSERAFPVPLPVIDPPGFNCAGRFAQHAWDGDTCITCGAHAQPERAS